mmetsp:Transcript_9994/g.15124  ORF Transcript_9994/g.15124 Transcript_9994/m.15124 type:complete len:110 (+) Transcript_9994:536-865(+)
MRKLTNSEVYYSDEEILTLEDKIYYGSDSSGASEENFQAIMGEKQEAPVSDSSSEFLVDKNEFDEEGEYEYEEGEYESEEDGEQYTEEDESELAFDQSKYEEEKVASDG